VIAVSLEVLKHYGLIESGEITEVNIAILCPFHEEETPSCQIQLEREWFYCFGCGAKGTLLDLVARLEGVNNLTASLVISKIARGVQKDSPTYAKLTLLREPVDDVTALKQSQVFFFSLAKPSWPLITSHYMLDRGFTQETLIKFDVRINVSADYPIAVPIRENGVFKGYMTRCLDDRPNKYLMSRGMKKTQVLSGRVRPGATVLLVEGKFDQMMCWQNGCTNVVSPLNWSISEAQLDKLAPASALICGFDNDRAGYDGYVRLRSLAKIPVVRLQYPSWIHDPAEFSKPEFQAAMAIAKRGLS
jgi:DNA primase